MISDGRGEGHPPPRARFLLFQRWAAAPFVLMSSLGTDWLPLFLLTVLTQRLGRRISFTAALENDFITQMHELLFTKNILFSS